MKDHGTSSASAGGEVAAGDQRRADVGDQPTAYGAILGDALALIAAAGRKDMPAGMTIPDTCLTCAFREGTLPNRMGGTAKQALDCVLGIDRDRFACHHGIKAGEPRRLCAGYLAAMIAPFSFVKEVLDAAHKDLSEFNEGDADAVRDDYVRWLSEIDPSGKMDVYQIARAYALRADVPRPISEIEATHLAKMQRSPAPDHQL